MKNEIILWLSSLIIAFLIGYIKNVTDPNYPITGTFGIEGKKVSYKLDKVSFNPKSYHNIIISDINGIDAELIWQDESKKYITAYTRIERGLECNIPNKNPGQSIKYKIIIHLENKTFEIPKDEFVHLTFWGNIPSPVKMLYFIFLYGVLLISNRCLLELFNRNKHLKKLAFIICGLMICLVTLIYPLYNTYKLGAINNFVPSFDKLLNSFLLVILILWVVGTILIFNKKYINAVIIIISSITVLIFFFI